MFKVKLVEKKKFFLSGAFERDFDMDVKIVRTRGWGCTMQSQA
jgi:hypothetical protein